MATKAEGVIGAAGTGLATKVMAMMAVEGRRVVGLWVGVDRVAAVQVGVRRATAAAWACIAEAQEGCEGWEKQARVVACWEEVGTAAEETCVASKAVAQMVPVNLVTGLGVDGLDVVAEELKRMAVAATTAPEVAATPAPLAAATSASVVARQSLLQVTTQTWASPSAVTVSDRPRAERNRVMQCR